jgi:hypothetical protein
MRIERGPGVVARSVALPKGASAYRVSVPRFSTMSVHVSATMPSTPVGVVIVALPTPVNTGALALGAPSMSRSTMRTSTATSAAPLYGPVRRTSPPPSFGASSVRSIASDGTAPDIDSTAPSTWLSELNA